jgi:hypothetical protein
MLLAEAARAAGIGHEGAALGRPACAMNDPRPLSPQAAPM